MRFFRSTGFFFLLIISTSAGLLPTPADKLHAAEKPVSTPPTVRLGIITLYHPLVMYRKYQPFADYLTNATPFTFELKISESYAQIIEGLRSGKVQAAILGGMTYLEARRETDILPLLAAVGKDGKPVCTGAFITRDDTDIADIADIKGKRFAFASTHSTSGSLMPLAHLYTRTPIRLDDFQSHVHLKYHDSVVREVLRGNFDAGVVLGTIAEQYETVGLKIIGRTDPFPGFVLVVRRDLPPRVVEALRSALLGLDPHNARHRKMMQDWDVNIRFGFTPTSDGAYERIRRAVADLSAKDVEWR